MWPKNESVGTDFTDSGCNGKKSLISPVQPPYGYPLIRIEQIQFYSIGSTPVWAAFNNIQITLQEVVYMKKKKLQTVKSTVSEMFELPKEITLNMPKINLIGNNQMLVENHRGIIEYTPSLIRVNSTVGVIRVQGNELNLRNIAAEDIMISGDIRSMEFI